jgi:hypothetical protein
VEEKTSVIATDYLLSEQQKIPKEHPHLMLDRHTFTDMCQPHIAFSTCILMITKQFEGQISINLTAILLVQYT